VPIFWLLETALTLGSGLVHLSQESGWSRRHVFPLSLNSTARISNSSPSRTILLAPPRRQPLFPEFSISMQSLPRLHLTVYLALASPNSLSRQIRSAFTDPFSSVTYHWNWFDAVILLPYFAVMIVLALYGVHRYTMCYQYFKYKKNYNPNPPGHFADLPRVTIQRAVRHRPPD
jgi:hypothetical protein